MIFFGEQVDKKFFNRNKVLMIHKKLFILFEKS